MEAYHKKQEGKLISVYLNAEMYAMVKENPRGIIRQALMELKESEEASKNP